MQYLWCAYNAAYFGGLILMACAFWPLGRQSAGWIPYPWFIPYGAGVFFLALVLGAIYGIAVS